MIRPPILRRVVLSCAAAAALATAPAALGAPEIDGVDNEVWGAARLPVVYTVRAERPESVRWFIYGSESEPVRSGTGVRVDGTGLDDGSYRLAVTDEHEEDYALRFFSVDTVPPVITVRAPLEGALYPLGHTVAVDFSCDEAVVCLGSQPSGRPLSTGVAGDHALEVTAVDRAGNLTRLRRNYRVVAPAPAPPPATRPPAPQVTRRTPAVAAPPTTNARRLRPRAGATVRARRPVLRWRAHPRARLYNVQVFRLAGTRWVKVLSSFPRTNRLRVPAGRLRPGRRHVWRVWPMVGRSFTAKPLGVSYFDVRPRRRR